MNIIFICIYSLLLIFSIYLEKKNYLEHITPMLFFVDIWCIVAIVANIGFYEYFLPSVKVNCMMVIMIITSIVSWNLIDKFRGELVENLRFSTCNLEFSVFGIICIESIFLIIMIPLLKNALSALNNGDTLELLRASIYDAKTNTGTQAEIRELLAKPVVSLISLIAILSLFNNLEIKKKFLIWICAVSDIVIYTVATAGRWQVLNFITFLIIAIILYEGDRVLRYIVAHKKYLMFIVSIIIVLFYITSQRSESLGVIKSFYMYYFSGPMYLTRLLEVNEKIFSINHDFMFGTATFGFICNFVSYFLILITHKPQGSLYMMGSVLTNHSYQVGMHTELNAMCTCIYDFLVDWGYLGIIIGPIVVMSIAHYLYKNAIKRNNMASKVMLIFYINVLITSIFKWGLISMDFSIIFFYLLFLDKTKNVAFKM